MSYVALNKLDVSVSLGESVEVAPVAAGAVHRRAGAREPPSGAIPTPRMMTEYHRANPDDDQLGRQPDRPRRNYNSKGQPPSGAQLAIRETTEVQSSSYLTLVPPAAPRYLLVADKYRKQLRVFDLLRPSGPGVAVLHGDGMRVMTAALSGDGDSICLSCKPGDGLRVYDTAPLLAAAATLMEDSKAEAEEQVVPRARAPSQGTEHDAAAGVAFSHNADRLFVLWHNGVTVHDPWQPSLPVLRRLPFEVKPGATHSPSMLACAGGLLAAAGGGGFGSSLPA